MLDVCHGSGSMSEAGVRWIIKMGPELITTKFQNQFRKASLSLSVAVDLPNTKSFGSSDFLDFLTPSKPKEVDDKQCKE